MKSKVKKKFIIPIIVAVLTLVLLIAGFMARSWIRNSVLPWVANQTKGKQVNNAFNSSFEAVNKQLTRSDVPINQSQVSPPCSASNYHHFRVSMGCSRTQFINNGNNNSPTPEPLIKNWSTILRSLNMNSSVNSWRVDKSTSNVAKPEDLFRFNGTTRNEVGFMRQVGPVQCTLYFAADPAYNNYESAYFIYEICGGVGFSTFGGWDCSKNYCRP
jgi:hypothetical protein